VIRSPERQSFDRITDLIHIGSRIGSADDYHRLRAYGVRACIDMKEEHADPWTFEAFLWLPTVDHEPPSQIHLHLGMAFLRQCEQAKMPVLVHCLAGIGRSATLVLAHLLSNSHRAAGTQAALDAIRLKRPLANPTRRQIEAAEQAAASFVA